MGIIIHHHGTWVMIEAWAKKVWFFQLTLVWVRSNTIEVNGLHWCNMWLKRTMTEWVINVLNTAGEQLTGWHWCVWNIHWINQNSGQIHKITMAMEQKVLDYLFSVNHLPSSKHWRCDNGTASESNDKTYPGSKPSMPREASCCQLSLAC